MKPQTESEITASLALIIYGRPIAQARPKFRRLGKFVRTYNPQESEAGKFGMAVFSQLPSGFVPISGPVRLICEFAMPIPESASRRKQIAMSAGLVKHTKKPDLDNLVKFVKDSIKGVVWIDDSQVVEIQAMKIYDGTPATRITIQAI